MSRITKLFFSSLFFILSCKQDDAGPVVTTTPATFDQNAETETIVAVIDNETACFFARDYECWKAHYAHVDYAFQAWNRMDGTFDAKVGWPAINQNAGKYIQDNPVPPGGSSHPKVERRNMKVKFFNETLAYLTWDQYNSNPQMNAYTHSLETRLMEKMGTTWKIVNVTSYWDYINLVPIDSLK
ncbi:MAG TPA: hypothetical protein VGK46_15510 [Saprospiraceae bacterium]